MKHDRIYPHHPGHRGNRDTSIAAAEEIADSLASMQIRIADAIRDSAGLTGEEIAEKTGISVYTVRARTSELQAMGWIRDSRERRENPAGRKVTVWAWIAPADREKPEKRAAKPMSSHTVTCPDCGARFHHADNDGSAGSEPVEN